VAEQYVVDLRDVDRTRAEVAGGKGAQLGSLARIEGVAVPGGFCVTTDAFRLAVARVPEFEELLERLSDLAPDDRVRAGELAERIRRAVEAAGVPDEVAVAVREALARLGERGGYAVRSSATAEDLPTASFAGQQDSYLNVLGPAEVLRHVSRCWASLFTERAVAYRQRAGIDHRTVRMAVVVQRAAVCRVDRLSAGDFEVGPDEQDTQELGGAGGSGAEFGEDPPVLQVGRSRVRWGTSGWLPQNSAVRLVKLTTAFRRWHAPGAVDVRSCAGSPGRIRRPGARVGPCPWRGAWSWPG